MHWMGCHHILCAGAFGYFEVTHDITKYTKAKVFSQIGKKTPLAVRFSTVGEDPYACYNEGRKDGWIDRCRTGCLN